MTSRPPSEWRGPASSVTRVRTPIEHPLLIGAASGGVDAKDALLSRYGLDLGGAFQLRDDLLGVFGDPETTSKPAGGDLREGKRTVLIAHTLTRAHTRWARAHRCPAGTPRSRCRSGRRAPRDHHRLRGRRCRGEATIDALTGSAARSKNHHRSEPRAPPCSRPSSRPRRLAPEPIRCIGRTDSVRPVSIGGKSNGLHGAPAHLGLEAGQHGVDRSTLHREAWGSGSKSRG